VEECVGCGAVGDFVGGGVAINGKGGSLCSECMRASTNDVLVTTTMASHGISREEAEQIVAAVTEQMDIPQQPRSESKWWHFWR
jgi:hypothetical protein